MQAGIRILAAQSALPRATTLARDLMCRLAPNDVRAIDIASLDKSHAAQLAVAILLLDGSLSAADASSLLHGLEDLGVATLVIDAPGNARCGNWFRSEQLVSEATPVEHLAGIVNGLLRTGPESARLRRELETRGRLSEGLEDRIMRIQEELQTAARIQREFLPAQLPSVHGVEFAALWRPAHFVSGDIYDVQILDEDHVGLFIADCVGHGVPAALMTMTIVHALSMQVLSGVRHAVPEPGAVLAQLNEDLLRSQSETPRFATAVYAVLNCRTRALHLAGAGHPAPLLVSESGEQRELITDGGLLGIFPDAEFSQVECTLAPGDRMMFFSDGFEQAFPCPDRGPVGRAAPADVIHGEFVRAARRGSAQEMVERLGARLNDQAGSLHPQDDLTLLCTYVGAPVSEDLPERCRAVQAS